MRFARRLLIALLVAASAFGALNRLASERVEVVTLHTRDSAGEANDTRIWVLDHGHAYIRSGPGSGWYTRLAARPTFELTRGGVRRTYRAVERPELRETLNARFRAKYGWGDAFISAVMGGRQSSILLELVPAN